MKLGLLCGGSSLERGISLNSARSVLDHLESKDIEIIPIYFDTKRNAYKISKNQLYSNTPSDFDFKLKQTSRTLSMRALINLLKSTDIVFPVMHGQFGEDGEIQRFLEKHKIPYIGSSARSCKLAFDKYIANEFIAKHDFFTLPCALLKIYHKDHKKIINQFFKKNNIKRAVVKPASGGSSIGVFSVSTPKEALEKAELLFSKRMDTRLVLEPFAEGTEFTIIILENRFGLPVSLPPTEIETDYTEHQIFDFRKKYLPTRQVIWHCPPRFDDKVIERIQAQAEQLFALFGMRDFARFDGWVLPDGNIWFCDFNPISGMEQNSFLFQQAARIGMTHSDVLKHILRSACRRNHIKLPTTENSVKKLNGRKPVNVIFGGNTSERQVSLMSGTNVWLKLRQSQKYDPKPYLLDTEGNVWKLPYHFALNHTVEEIMENCKNHHLAKERLSQFEQRAKLRLGWTNGKIHPEFFEPTKMTLDHFIKNSEFVFIALHGGEGENGTFQRKFTENNIEFNGAPEEVSKLCMDKWLTSELVRQIAIPGIHAIPGKLVHLNELKIDDVDALTQFWRDTKKLLSAETLIVKPRADGCSSGVAHLYSVEDLKKYLQFLTQGKHYIPKNTLRNQLDQIELPLHKIEDLIFEKYISTDILRVCDNKLKFIAKTGWIEVTVGVIEINNKIRAFNPSITIAEGEVLSVEEKFQGGTGINITPPPAEILSKRHLEKVKKLITKLAYSINLKGYARIDAFVNIHNGDIMIIEVNTLPGLTPSTVFYHQALAEKPSLTPRMLLEKLIENKKY